MASLSGILRRVPLPAVATYLYQAQWTACEAEKPAVATVEEADLSLPSTKEPTVGMRASEEGEYHDLFPKRQLWQPKYEYPLWDDNWDGRAPASLGDKSADRERMRRIRKTGVTRHIILIRHGQYDETHKEDEKRILTELGRKQAELTGMRIGEMIRGAQDAFGPCNVKVIRVSNLARARETANIIAESLPDTVERAEPDPLLNEGRPAHTIPGGPAKPSVVELTDTHHPRIESAFRKYIYRAPYQEDETVVNEASYGEEKHKRCLHEFEVIVCHANVIRYFLCRALQLPPEAWLRLCTFNCSLTYLTIRPTGSVSCRMLGDVGHIPYGMITFSRHEGFNW